MQLSHINFSFHRKKEKIRKLREKESRAGKTRSLKKTEANKGRIFYLQRDFNITQLKTKVTGSKSRDQQLRYIEDSDSEERFITTSLQRPPF